MSRFSITAVLAIFLVLLGTRATATTMHTYNGCTTAQRNYIEERLEEAMSSIEEVVEADKIPDEWGIDESGRRSADIPSETEQAFIVRMFTAALNDLPNLAFTCPQPGSDKGICKGVPDADSYEATEAYVLPWESDTDLWLCPGPKMNREKISTAWIRAGLIHKAFKELSGEREL